MQMKKLLLLILIVAVLCGGLGFALGVQHEQDRYAQALAERYSPEHVAGTYHANQWNGAEANIYLHPEGSFVYPGGWTGVWHVDGDRLTLVFDDHTMDVEATLVDGGVLLRGVFFEKTV